MDQAVLRVEGMMCNGCKGKVERALRGLAGVSSCEVDLEAGKAAVVYDPAAVTAAAMKTAVEEKGFAVTAVE